MRPGFDLVISDHWVVVLNQGGFEQMYGDLGLIDRHSDNWVNGITEALPMAPTSIEAET